MKNNNSKKEIFSGKDLLKTNIFGFYYNNYDSDGYEPISVKESMKNILREFKSTYKPFINNKLKTIGLKLVDVKYYSPKEYNYGDDELDFYIKIIDLRKVLDFLYKNKITTLEEKNKGLKERYYNISIEEMSKVFEILELTADDLEIDTEFIFNNLEFDMRYKGNKDK